jgi:hypothetical protein
MHLFKRFISVVLIASTTLLGLPQMAHAGIVSTEAVISAETAQAQRAQVNAFFARADVRSALEQQGVKPDAAVERVNTMTDTEVAELAGRIDQAPAGGDVLGLLFLVFVILLVTDIMGLTKVFPFTRSVR